MIPKRHDSKFEDGLKKLKHSISRAGKNLSLLRFIFALAFAEAIAILWMNTANPHALEVVFVGVLAFTFVLMIHDRVKPKKVSLEELRISYTVSDDANSKNIEGFISKELKFSQRFNNIRIGSHFSVLSLPIILSLLLAFIEGPAFGEKFVSQVRDTVFFFFRGATLTVEQGLGSEKTLPKYTLTSGKTPTIKLLEKNVIKIRIVAAHSSSAPNLKLKSDGKVSQEFQIAPILSSSPDNQTFEVSFSVTDSSDLYISSVSNSPIAKIEVKKLPVPKVELKLAGLKKDPWHDDKPLPLLIEAKATHPLSKIELLVRVGKNESKELVSKILVEDKKKYTNIYEILLEPYLENDFAEVEIIALATDKASPLPLEGYSVPLRINVASAYGRYRQTLQTLRQIKPIVDEALSEQFKEIQQIKELADKALSQSGDSPFFDALDRMTLSEINKGATQLATQKDMATAAELSEKLNDFLFEHETLDDRERDRDFFVAVRGLSRLLEKEYKDRPVKARVVAERIVDFLEDRFRRWTLRTSRVDPGSINPLWKKIQHERPFKSALQKVEKLDNNTDAGTQESVDILSRIVVEYRTWIDTLEKAEERHNEKREQKRQQQIASAKDQIKELRKRQSQISSKLDKSLGREEQIQEGWGLTQMKQKTNIKGARQAGAQLASVSPVAAQRLEASIKAMKETLQTGNENKFGIAESNSDLAARLLIMANNAASKSQQKRRRRGRRRRVTGDNYHGKSVHGGDVEIKREYEVDKQFREAILDEIQNSDLDTKSRDILDSYLQKVIR